MHKIFNMSTLKLVAALAIPGFIIWFFVDSQNQANKAVEEFQHEQRDLPHEDKVVIKNYAIKEVDDNNSVRWQLCAKSGEALPDSKEVHLDDVQVEYFDVATKTLKLKLTAPIGSADEASHVVKLVGGKGREVIAEAEGGKNRFQCHQVELIKRNEFLATGGVIIDWPGVAKVMGNSASGNIEMGTAPKNLKITGNTHTLIYSH